MNRVYLVRHGENPANLKKQFSHRIVDYSLTPKGVLQSQQTAAFFKDKAIDAIYSSPLKRARETAEIIGAELGLLVITDEAFREINVGMLETEPPSAENWQHYFAIVGDWARGKPETAFPDGENFHMLLARMREGLARALAGRDGQNIVLVAHGGVFAATITSICPDVDLKRILGTENHNCSISEVTLAERNGMLVGELAGWALCEHISGEAAEFVLAVPDEHRAGTREVL